MVQYEQLSVNAKKAIEQYRNCKDMRNGKITPIDIFEESLTLNNVLDEEKNSVLDFAKTKGYWLNVRKKEENKK